MGKNTIPNAMVGGGWEIHTVFYQLEKKRGKDQLWDQVLDEDGKL